MSENDKVMSNLRDQSTDNKMFYLPMNLSSPKSYDEQYRWLKSDNKHKKLKSGDIKSNMYSLGLIALWMATFKQFKHHSRKQLTKKTEKLIINEWIELIRECYPQEENVYYMIKNMLQWERFKRPDFRSQV